MQPLAVAKLFAVSAMLYSTVMWQHLSTPFGGADGEGPSDPVLSLGASMRWNFRSHLKQECVQVRMWWQRHPESHASSWGGGCSENVDYHCYI